MKTFLVGVLAGLAMFVPAAIVIILESGALK
jgi:hypothetical protein